MLSIESAPEELQSAIKEFFPPEEWDNAASISYLESGWNAFAELDTTKQGTIACGTPIGDLGGMPVSAEHSIGWFQINACNFQSWNWANFFNTRHNVGTAHMLWAERGWQPWYFSATQLGLIEIVGA
jgi:hypothetical protein